MEKGSVRIVLGRRIQFGNQVRTAPIHVHPRCVQAAIDAEDNATEPEGLIEALREAGPDLPSNRLEVGAGGGARPGLSSRFRVLCAQTSGPGAVGLLIEGRSAGPPPRLQHRDRLVEAPILRKARPAVCSGGAVKGSREVAS